MMIFFPKRFLYLDFYNKKEENKINIRNSLVVKMREKIESYEE